MLNSGSSWLLSWKKGGPVERTFHPPSQPATEGERAKEVALTKGNDPLRTFAAGADFDYSSIACIAGWSDRSYGLAPGWCGSLVGCGTSLRCNVCSRIIVMVRELVSGT